MMRNTPELSHDGVDARVRKAGGRVVVAVAAATATGALAYAVCCVLPFALPAVALASAGSIIAWCTSAELDDGSRARRRRGRLALGRVAEPPIVNRRSNLALTHF